MRKIMHLALVMTVFFGTYVLAWLLTLFLPLGEFGFIGNLLALVVAVIVARRVWLQGSAVPRSALGAMGYGAAVLGSIGFAAGFFGPMLLAPQANQGPLLGIFITGPAGALLGAVGGLLYGLKRSADPNQA
jgi:hypothetical protein